MFSRLFILALLVLVDLSVDAAPVLNSDQNRMEETRKEHEEALKSDNAQRSGGPRSRPEPVGGSPEGVRPL